MDEKILSYIKKYAISFAILGISTWFILALREFSASDAAAVKYLNLADSFTIPAVIILMVGVLVWISTTGSFDMFSYGLSRAKESFVPSVRYKDEKFYDYKMRKEKKRIKGYSFLFVSGGIYMIPAIIFNILYYVSL